jgi:hypothetical protein
MAAKLPAPTVKSLAFRVLRELAARNADIEVRPAAPEQMRQVKIKSGDSVETSGGNKLHLSKIREEYKNWLEDWQPRGTLQ